MNTAVRKPQYTMDPWHIYRIPIEFSGEVVAEIKNDSGDLTPEDWANARLISAAPELLVALISLLNAIKANPSIYSDPKVFELVQLAKAAIIKAGGNE